jgi:hypothetical protein
MSNPDATETVTLPADDRLAFEKVLFGTTIICGTILAAPLLGLLFGLAFMSIVDVLRADHQIFVTSVIGFFIVYALGVAGIAVGLHACCQVPPGFPGRVYAQSAFALTLATAAVPVLSCGWLTKYLTGPWLALRHELLLDFMLAASGGLAVSSGLLFIRSVGAYLGERELADRAWRQLRVFAWWLTGVILLALLVHFLDVVVTWLHTIYAAWLWIGGAAMMLGIVMVIGHVRRALRHAAR